MSSVLLLCFFVLFLRPGSSSLHALQQQFKEEDAPLPGSRLLLVQAVFRHGARTPLNTIFWPETPYSDCHNEYPGPSLELKDETGLPDPPPIQDMGNPELPGGCRMGQLTHIGHDMAIQLGSWLRRRYVGPSSSHAQLRPPLLPSSFRPDTLLLRTTCIQRAALTLQGVLSGLYPDLEGPVSVYATQERLEFMYGKNTTCPALGPLLQEISSLLAERDAEDTEMQREATSVRRALGLPSSPLPLDWVRLHDSLAAMQAEGMPLPSGLDDDVWATIVHQAVRHEAAHVGPTPEDGLLDDKSCKRVIGMSVGPLVWRLGENMRAAVAAAVAGGREEEERRAGRALRSRAKGVSEAAPPPVGAATLKGRGEGEGRGRGGQPAEPGRYHHHSTAAPGQVQRQGSSEVAAATAVGLESMQELLRSVLEVERGRRQQQDGGSEAGRAPLPPPRRLHLYSGHDSTITPLLVALGQPETVWPPFTSSLVFELWERPAAATTAAAAAAAGRKGGGHWGQAPSDGAGGDGGSANGREGRDGGTAAGGTTSGTQQQQQQRQHDVRVYFNQQLMKVPGSRPGGWIDLHDLTRMLEPFSLSDQAKAGVCRLPTPQRLLSSSDLL